MAKTDFIPRSDADFLLWHDQFKNGAAAQAAIFGLAAADTAAVTADNTNLHAKIAGAIAAQSAAQQATTDKTATRNHVEKNVRALARRIKTHPAYTPAVGVALGIEGPEDSTDMSAAKPVLAPTDQTGGAVQLDFPKSKSDGVNIYSRREGDADFVFLARDTQSPYVDNRPLLAAGKPEVRRYQAVYVVNDEEVGHYSDDVVVTCQP